MSKWLMFDLLTRRPKSSLPDRPCVYAVYFGCDLVYIGQTNRLCNRFAEHKFRRGYANEIITPWCELPGDTQVTIKAKFSERYGDWAMWEIRLIHRLKPIFNFHHKKRRG